MDVPQSAAALTDYLRRLRRETGCKGFVIGLSGGLDSAVVTKLAVDAIGPKDIVNVFMPADTTSKDDYRITSELSGSWGTEYKVISIQPALDAFIAMTGTDDRADIGNIAARSRAIVLYNEARRRGYIVLGTSNKSELMMGYFTKYGDGACDAMLISGLFKTQVRRLAKEIAIPDEVISKPPSAGLWEGQTDEDDMQISYDDLDVILEAIDAGANPFGAAPEGVSREDVQRIVDRVASMRHKSVPPYRP